MIAKVRWKWGVLGASLLLGLSGCKDKPTPEGELLVTAEIGPAGGELVGAGLTLTVPPGAVPTETLFELRTASVNLSASTYRQTGQTYRLFPELLPLALPARATFDSGPDDPAVLFQQDGLTVAADGLTTYINELNVIAVGEAGPRLTNIVEPVFSPTPEGATAVHDAIHFNMQVTEAPQVNLVISLYDYDDVHMQDLNGSAGLGDCGLRVDNAVGASLSGGCTDTPITAALRISSGTVEFDAVPDQAGKVSPAVPAAVIAGGSDLAYFFGFVSFDTSACYEETCSGRGTCELDAAGNGACVCDPGFAVESDPFTCVCQPQCDGRECGNDNCGGQCPPGCQDNQFCDDEAGQCRTPPPGTGTDTDGDPTTSGDDSTTGGSGTTVGDSGTGSGPTGTGTG